MKNKIQIQAGTVIRIKRATCAVDGGVATLDGPPGRQLVALVMGVSDPGAPFNVPAFFAALGYVPGPQLQAELDKEKGDAN